jgi:hypothetical protein
MTKGSQPLSAALQASQSQSSSMTITSSPLDAWLPPAPLVPPAPAAPFVLVRFDGLSSLPLLLLAVFALSSTAAISSESESPISMTPLVPLGVVSLRRDECVRRAAVGREGMEEAGTERWIVPRDAEEELEAVRAGGGGGFGGVGSEEAYLACQNLQPGERLQTTYNLTHSRAVSSCFFLLLRNS